MGGANGSGNGSNGGGNGSFDGDFEATHYTHGQPWPEPVPFAKMTISAPPYPIEGASDLFHDAVMEEHRVNEQPIELIGTSLLAGLATAYQHIINIDSRTGATPLPISLFALVVAKSGERKSTADNNLVRGPLIAAIHAKTEAMAAEIARINAAHARWKREKADLERLLTRVRTATKKSVGSQADAREEARAIEAQIEACEANEPSQAIKPKPPFDDVTGESLKYEMATGWPSNGLISSEGGMFVGGRSMNEDNALFTCSLFIDLNDGRPLCSARRSSGTYYGEGRRFSLSLLMQPEVFDRFLAAAGGIVRSSGLLARFLLAAPPPAVHLRRRIAQEPDGDRPALAAIRGFIGDCIAQPLPTTARDLALSPPSLLLPPPAFRPWADYYDRITCDVGPGGQFQDITELAVRSPEMALRIAAGSHIQRVGPRDALRIAIDPATVEWAVAMADWHLHEARRLLVDSDVETMRENARRLLAWMLRFPAPLTRAQIGDVTVRRLRDDRRARNAALAQLVKMNLVRETKVGRISVFETHPASVHFVAN